MKWLKWIAGIIISLMLILFILVKVASEDMPTVAPSIEADALADKMMSALGKEAWDTTAYFQWTFRGVNNYLWDKKNNNAVIEWDKKKVVLNLDEISGTAYVDGKVQSGAKKDDLIAKAWSNWCNDSFWMFAPFKAKDAGTSRTIIENVEEGNRGLLVSYDSGGVTPGDKYLWILNENNEPIAYKMWVKIIPIGGFKATWENWLTTDAGVKLSTSHKLSFLSLNLENVKAGMTLSELGINEDPFNF